MSPCSSVMRCRVRIDLAAHHDALEDQPLVVGRRRIEHDPAAAERKHPIAAGLRRRGELGSQRVAGGAGGDLERHAQRTPGAVPVEADFGAADRDAVRRIVGVADRSALRDDRAGHVCGVPSAAISESIEADTSVSERSRVSDMRSASRSSSTTLRASSCRRRWPRVQRRQRGAHHPRPLLALRQHAERYAAVVRAGQAQADLLELPLAAVAAVVDGEAAVGDADLGQRWPSKPPVSALPLSSSAAKAVDPGEQRREIGGDTAFRHRLQRKVVGQTVRCGTEVGARLRGRRRCRRQRRHAGRCSARW